MNFWDMSKIPDSQFSTDILPGYVCINQIYGQVTINVDVVYNPVNHVGHIGADTNAVQ